VLGVVAGLLLSLVPAHRAAPASLTLSTQFFSPQVAALQVTASLRAPAVAGLRLTTTRGQSVGWLLKPSRRSQISFSWLGRIARQPVPDGYYAIQVATAKQVLARATFKLDTTPPHLTNFRASNGGAPYAGDTPMLTTLSPYDGVRTTATIAFTLSEQATLSFVVERTDRTRTIVTNQTDAFGAGRNSVTWTPPVTIAPRTYLLELSVTDLAGNTRTYGAESPYTRRYFVAPVVRVIGIDANFLQPSYTPGANALLRVRTDAPSFTMQFFRVGGEPRPSYLVNEMSGLPADDPETILWAGHANAPATIRLRLGDWPTGMYYAKLTAPDGRFGYAPFILRPTFEGLHNRVAVIMSTRTWQAYNFYDANGDGWGDTWYAGRNDLHVGLVRPYLNSGVPPKFSRYENQFINWMARSKVSADFLAEQDLDAIPNGTALLSRYRLVVFPGHTEYVTDHEYDLIEQYRNAGGHLMFLSANNFFRRVVVTDGTMIRTHKWRELGRPESAILGAQYRANDEGQHQGDFIVRDTTHVPWLWQGLNFQVGSTFGQVVGGYGIEIDSTTKASPPGTIVIAEIPNLLGPGLTAQMTYYETKNGAKVFDAGTLDFVGSALTFPVNHMLLNLWNHLSSA
jgi:hypothetical protein